MKKNYNSRFNHVGKNPYEKGVYENFLNSNFKLDKTEEDPIDLSKTDSSSFESKKLDKGGNIKEKSFSLRIKDWTRSNMGVTIIGGFVVVIVMFAITGYISVIVNQNRTDDKVANLEKRTDAIDQKETDIASAFNIFDKNFALFKLEVTKDIQSLTQRISSVFR